MFKLVNFSDLQGKILLSIDQREDVLEFTCATSEKYKMFHIQECCEDIHLEDVIGDLQSLIGHEILLAEEITNSFEKGTNCFTWTFYKIATLKNYVTLKWEGSSNGYYSERVDFVQIN